nr:hypothetical protein 4p_00014 [Serratia proteamaculans]ULG15161.1 hypothetical protein 163p1_00010 [Serratia proteamaculans]ULG19469.1 hypothetical protein SpFp1_00102 [Serratia proteamaculans]
MLRISSETTRLSGTGFNTIGIHVQLTDPVLEREPQPA